MKIQKIFIGFIVFVAFLYIPIWLMIDIETHDPYAREVIKRQLSAQHNNNNNDGEKKLITKLESQEAKNNTPMNEKEYFRPLSIDPRSWMSSLHHRWNQINDNKNKNNNHHQDFHDKSMSLQKILSDINEIEMRTKNETENDIQIIDFRAKKFREKEIETIHENSNVNIKKGYKKFEEKPNPISRDEIEAEQDVAQLFWQRELNGGENGDTDEEKIDLEIISSTSTSSFSLIPEIKKSDSLNVAVVVVCISGEHSLHFAKEIIRHENENNINNFRLILLVPHDAEGASSPSSSLYIHLQERTKEEFSTYPHLVKIIGVSSSKFAAVNVWSLLPYLSRRVLTQINNKNDNALLIFFGPGVVSAISKKPSLIVQKIIETLDSPQNMVSPSFVGCTPISYDDDSSKLLWKENRNNNQNNFHLGQGLEIHQGHKGQIWLDERFAGFSSKDGRTTAAGGKNNSTGDNGRFSISDVGDGIPLATVSPFCFGTKLKTLIDFWPSSSSFSNFSVIAKSNTKAELILASSIVKKMNTEKNNKKFQNVEQKPSSSDFFVSYDVHGEVLTMMLNAAGFQFWVAPLQVATTIVLFDQIIFFPTSSSWTATYSQKDQKNNNGEVSVPAAGIFAITESLTSEISSSKKLLHQHLQTTALARLFFLSNLPLPWWSRKPRRFFKKTILRQHDAQIVNISVESDNLHQTQEQREKLIEQHLLENYQKAQPAIIWETFCVPCFGFTNEVMHFVWPLEGRIQIRVRNGIECFCFGSPKSFTRSLLRLGMVKAFESDPKKSSPMAKDGGDKDLLPRANFVVVPGSSTMKNQQREKVEIENAIPQNDNNNDEVEDDEEENFKQQQEILKPTVDPVQEEKEEKSIEEELKQARQKINQKFSWNRRNKDSAAITLPSSTSSPIVAATSKKIVKKPKTRIESLDIFSSSSSSSSSSSLPRWIASKNPDDDNKNGKKPSRRLQSWFDFSKNNRKDDENENEEGEKFMFKKKSENQNNKNRRSNHDDGHYIVLILHKDPGSLPDNVYGLNSQGLYRNPDAVIARSMFEFTKVPQNWKGKDSIAKEVWVPSRFVRWVFENQQKENRESFFDVAKLVVVGEPIDVYYYDPATVQPLVLPIQILKWKRDSTRPVHQPQFELSPTFVESSHRNQFPIQRHYKFFSSFKWESRKGWEILLKAYFQEFAASEPVSLYISSYLYGDDSRDPKKLMEFVKQIALEVLQENDNISKDSIVADRRPQQTPKASEDDVLIKIKPASERYLPKRGRFASKHHQHQSFENNNAKVIISNRKKVDDDEEKGDESARNKESNNNGIDENENSWKHKVPHVEIITERISEGKMVELYRSVDAFVLPTRGEGWGLPAIQAMSMSLPVLLTNWSGNVDFMMSTDSEMVSETESRNTSNVSSNIRRDSLHRRHHQGQICYPIRVEKLEPAIQNPGDAQEEGKDWAVPSLGHLRELMRHVFTNPEEARQRGAKARSFIVAQFSDEAIAEMVARRVEYLMEKDF